MLRRQGVQVAEEGLGFFADEGVRLKRTGIVRIAEDIPYYIAEEGVAFCVWFGEEDKESKKMWRWRRAVGMAVASATRRRKESAKRAVVGFGGSKSWTLLGGSRFYRPGEFASVKGMDGNGASPAGLFSFGAIVVVMSGGLVFYGVAGNEKTSSRGLEETTSISLCESGGTNTNVEYSGVMLDEKSRELLKSKFPPRFPDNCEYHHMTVKYGLTEEEVEDLDDLLKTNLDLKVLGIAADEHCQTVLVESNHLHIQSRNSFPHVTLSVEGGEKYEAYYSNILLQRLASVGTKQDETDSTLTNDWVGVLPGITVDGVEYPPTQASFTDLRSQDLTISGTFCVKSKWKDGSGTCEHTRENECGFCLFMKGGPCREEFIAWEKCVGVTKDGEGDKEFVDRCAPQTLVLKSCVDANPEYYYVVTEEETQSD